jgi:integrase
MTDVCSLVSPFRVAKDVCRRKSHKVIDFIEDTDFTTDKSLIFRAGEIEGFSTDCTATPDMATPERPILFSERGGGLSAATVRLWFHRLYTSLKMDGCSSHSGRRTFITRAARRVSQVGGSLRDVQELAGHTSLAMTQRYIEGDTEAKRKLVALL